MKEPDFTHEERVLINWYLQKRSTLVAYALIPGVAYGTPTLVIALWGVYAESVFAVGLAFCMLVLFRAFVAIHELRWLPTIISIFQKYEDFVCTFCDPVMLNGDSQQSLQQGS